MKKFLAYLCLSALFYLQLSAPFLTFNIFPNFGVAYAQTGGSGDRGNSGSGTGNGSGPSEVCDPATAQSLGISCNDVARIQAEKETDCSSLIEIGNKGKEDANEQRQQDEQSKKDSEQARDQFEAIKFEESALMLGSDVVSGIVLLAIGVVAAMMVITCVKGLCSPGVYVAGAGGAIYLAGEIVAMIGYRKAMNKLSATQADYEKCEQALGVSRTGTPPPGSGLPAISDNHQEFLDATVSGSGTETGSGGTVGLPGISENHNDFLSNLSDADLEKVDAAQFGALKKQRHALKTIKDVAMAKALLQGAAVAAFLAATGMEIALAVKDNSLMSAAQSAAVSGELAEFAPTCPGACTLAASACYSICTSCGVAFMTSAIDIASFIIQYNTIFGGICNPSAAKVSALMLKMLAVHNTGDGICSIAPALAFAKGPYSLIIANMQAVSVSLGGHVFPNCNICGGPCVMVENGREMISPMGEEQKVSLQSKNLVEKVMDWMMPVAQASQTGDWVKGLGLGIMVDLVLIAMLGGFTSIADSLAVFPPSRAVLFGAMAALATVAMGITIAIISDVQSRITKIDALLEGWKDFNKSGGVAIGSGSGDNLETPASVDIPRPVPTPRSRPHGTPTPSPRSTPEASVIRKGIEKIFAWVGDIFNLPVGDAVSAVSTMAFTMPGNQSLPCFGKQSGTQCLTQSKAGLEAISKVPGLPDIIVEQSKRAINLSKDLSGARAISTESMNGIRTMVQDLGKTKAANDKLEKVYEQKQQELYDNYQQNNKKLIDSYNALSDKDKKTLPADFSDQLGQLAKFRPDRLKDSRQGFYKRLSQMVQKNMSKISESAKTSLSKSGFFNFNFRSKKMSSGSFNSEMHESLQVQNPAEENQAQKVVADGSYSNGSVEIASGARTGKEKDDNVDDLEVTVDDINRGKEIDIFLLISQRYRRIYKLTE